MLIVHSCPSILIGIGVTFVNPFDDYKVLFLFCQIFIKFWFCFVKFLKALFRLRAFSLNKMNHSIVSYVLNIYSSQSHLSGRITNKNKYKTIWSQFWNHSFGRRTFNEHILSDSLIYWIFLLQVLAWPTCWIQLNNTWL